MQINHIGKHVDDEALIELARKDSAAKFDLVLIFTGILLLLVGLAVVASIAANPAIVR